jgi:hypothetical protein
MLGGRRITLPKAIVAMACTLVLAGAADARPGLRHTLRTAPRLVGLNEVANERYQNAADALLETGVRNLPVHTNGSAAYTYVYDPSCHCYTQAPAAAGPWFVTERAEPVGRHLTTVSLTLAAYDMRDAFGCTFGEDEKPIRLSAGTLDYRAGTELRYQVATLGIIHGITDDLEVSAAIPFAVIDFGVNATASGGTTGGFARGSENFHVGPNVMDTMVRLKQRIWTGGPLTASVGGRARIPTGDAADGLGTGHGEIGPYGLLSGTFWDGILGSYLDAGFDAVVTDGRRSSAHYGLGLTLQPPPGTRWHDVVLTGEIFGRSEIAGIRHTSSVSGPHMGGECPYLCLDPSRQDYFDATLGVRFRVVRSLVVSLGVFKPINSDHGVRAKGFSPVGSIEATF